MADVTAQFPDTVVLEGDEYAIAGISGSGLFGAQAHGLKPRMISTACWRGYLCSYVVDKARRLRLDRLILGPGSRADSRKIKAGDNVLGRPVAPHAGWAGRGGLELTDLRLHVPFSGGLLLGCDFVTETYVHMGYHPAWTYEVVLELLVRDGAVTGVLDRSDQLAEVRRQVTSGDAPDPDGPRGGMKWVERTFALDYTRSLPD